MTAEMAMRKEISHARGHKRKVRAEGGNDEDAPEGLRHLKKAAAVQVEAGAEGQQGGKLEDKQVSSSLDAGGQRHLEVAGTS